MKKSIPGLCAVLLALAMPTPAYAGPAPAEVPVLIAEQIDSAGNPMPSSPATVEIIRLLAAESGLNLVLRPYPWRRAQMMAENGEGLLFGATATAERARMFYFTQPLYFVNQWLVSSAQAPLIFQRWEDLRGKVISIGSGGKYSPEFEQRRGTLFAVDENAASNLSRLKMVNARHVDALLIDSYRSAAQTAAMLNCVYKEAGSWVVAEKSIGAEAALIAVPRAPALAPLLPVLDRAIGRLIKTKSIQKILDSRAGQAGCN
ncbi:substrate-binding periplasmic protein [Duganella levis]|uniref:Transporter substrate-binding domain-containing protein n=1 Tax=Duganella levis TaxID=2692169 RepID=A0ABW9VTX3_9BURK|nr:transporter substrate-binding domain-containing protein [Duganella levis]MYN25073.1 transporter substrate-binding domain-containing protein [Duganella levis]